MSTDPHTPVPHQPTAGLAIAADQQTWTPQQVSVLAALGVEQASEGDLQLFFHQSKRSGLDPFAKQIYLVGRNAKLRDPGTGREYWGKKYTIQTGIDGYRLIARRAAQASKETLGYEDTLWCDQDGQWTDVWLKNTHPAAAKVVVLRAGARFPAIALWKEYVQTVKDGAPNSMWERMGAGQLAKCAEALALRKAYPQDLSGLYVDAEMGQADNTVRGEVVEGPAGGPGRPAAPPAAPAPALDPHAVREAILGANSRDNLKARLMGVGAADPKAGWHRADLEALTVADTDGTEVSGWDLFAARWMDLDPALAQVVDAEVVEDDTATPDTTSGAERREPAPKADPARRHPAMAAAMATVRAHAHTDETPEEQA